MREVMDGMRHNRWAVGYLAVVTTLELILLIAHMSGRG